MTPLARGAKAGSSVQLVWLKRDLRLHDHRPLLEASRRGPVICLYVYEPELYRAEEFDSSHLVFINQSLTELDTGLRALGGRVTYRVGPLPEVLEALRREIGISALWAHEETGQRVTRRRDRRVREWAKERGLPFHEFPQNGVVRGLGSRDGWSSLWNERMSRVRRGAVARKEAARVYEKHGSRRRPGSLRPTGRSS